MTIRIYFEGDVSLRAGFHGLFGELVARARARQVSVKWIATDGTPDQDFETAVRRNSGDVCLLLRDSERPLMPEIRREGVFWMVEVMESWFLADTEKLAEYYGRGFNRSALPRNPRVEQIPKLDVVAALNEATRQTKKRRYSKTGHAPDILAAIRLDLVSKAAPECQRFVDELKRLIESA